MNAMKPGQWIVCTDVGVLRHCLTKGKKYKVIKAKFIGPRWRPTILKDTGEVGQVNTPRFKIITCELNKYL